MQQHNRLSPAEAERLSILLEECGEVLQIIGKIQRHGFDSRNPLKVDSQTNRELLQKELGDLLNAFTMLCNSGDIDEAICKMYKQQKADSIARWLSHQN